MERPADPASGALNRTILATIDEFAPGLVASQLITKIYVRHCDFPHKDRTDNLESRFFLIT